MKQLELPVLVLTSILACAAGNASAQAASKFLQSTDQNSEI